MTVQSHGVRPVRPPAPEQKPPSRWPFWLGFTVSFLALSVLRLGLLLMSMGLDNFDLASLQDNEAAWSPPPLELTPAADPGVVDASAANNAGGTGQYATGANLRNITDGGVFIRETPGYLSKLETDKIGRIASGGTVQIVGGPATVDDLTWWRIRYQTGDGAAIEGWSAEATASGLQILAPVQ